MLYEPGDIVEYEDFGGGRRLVLVTARYDHDVKQGLNKADCTSNGCTVSDRAGFDGQIVGRPGEGVWGYDRQLKAVWRQTAPLPERN